jgi:nicotinamidase-related amidase
VAVELIKMGYKVTILADAISSSSLQERKLALDRLQRAGAEVTSTESWVFETIQDSQDPK